MKTTLRTSRHTSSSKVWTGKNSRSALMPHLSNSSSRARRMSVNSQKISPIRSPRKSLKKSCQTVPNTFGVSIISRIVAQTRSEFSSFRLLLCCATMAKVSEHGDPGPHVKRQKPASKHQGSAGNGENGGFGCCDPFGSLSNSLSLMVVGRFLVLRKVLDKRK